MSFTGGSAVGTRVKACKKAADPFRSWLYESRMLQSSRGARPSHLLLDGGRLYVKQQDEAYFLAKYAGLLRKGCVMCVVEARTPIFKLMFDLDLKLEAEVVEEDLLRLCQHLHGQVAAMYEGILSRSVFARLP